MSIRKMSISVALCAAAVLVNNPLFAGDKDVNVINTPDVNVANMPDVNVVNTPDVNIVNLPSVFVVGAPDVNVIGLPLVELVNTTGNPVPTRITNVEPIAVEVVEGNSNGQNGGILGPKKPSDLVTLMGIDEDCTGVNVRRIFPDATVEYGWTPPAGSVLVTTGFDWRGQSGTPGDIVQMSLFLWVPIVNITEAIFRDHARVGENGIVGRTASVKNAVFGPGTIPCIFMADCSQSSIG